MKKDYSQYKWTDLLDDPDYLEWVKNPSPERDRHWQEIFTSNPALPEESNIARSFLSNLIFSDLDNNPKTHTQIWSRIEGSISAETAPSGRIVNLKTISIIAAAACLLFLIVFKNVLWPAQSIELNTALAEKKEQVLPDGSTVQLNAESRISWNQEDFKKKRTIQLKGEAFFSVEKGTDFTVVSASGEVRVLGTRFNVYDRDGRMTVACFSGKVSVHFKTTGKSFILTAGQKVSNFEEISLVPKEFNPAEQKIWKDGYVYFENTSLDLVVQELNRQYGFKELNLPTELRQMKYSGFFRTDALDEALQSICLPLQLQYKLDAGNLTLERSK